MLGVILALLVGCIVGGVFGSEVRGGRSTIMVLEVGCGVGSGVLVKVASAVGVSVLMELSLVVLFGERLLIVAAKVRSLKARDWFPEYFLARCSGSELEGWDGFGWMRVSGCWVGAVGGGMAAFRLGLSLGVGVGLF